MTKVVPIRPNEWAHGLITTERGTPVKGLANTLHVLNTHPAWRGVVARDEFAECVVKRKRPPTRAQDGDSGIGEWTEADTTRTCGWFAQEIGFEPSPVHVENAVVAVAERNPVHPVRDYLRGVEWDGTERLPSMMHRYFGAEDTPYTRAVGVRWMIAAVARVMRPGCQVDSMPVFEGPQGVGKSTGCEALFGQQWCADTGVNIGDKDSYQALRAKWGYEFGELHAIKGRDLEKIKSFISARSDTFRPSYARRTRDFPRQVVFYGTTNESAYLVDRTGNRRFWPVRCSRVDVEGIKRDRDQLWAEAVARYDAGEPWHLDTPELRALASDATDERLTEDSWSAVIAAWIANPTELRDYGAGMVRREKLEGLDTEGVSTAEVMEHALNLQAQHMTPSATMRVGSILRSLGWEPRQARRGGPGVRVRLYFPLSSQPADVVTGGVTGGCDTDSPCENSTNSHLSHPSHQYYSHSYEEHHAHAAHALNESARDSRDGCDAVTADPVDELERAAIEAEGRGEL